jgi:hypothetical protein
MAGGVVTNCTQAALAAALAGGGTVTFACNGTITLSNTIDITANTTLDGTGAQISISGGNTNRLFYVSTNVSFRLASLTLANGSVCGTNAAGGAFPAPGLDAGGACLLNQGGTVTLNNCLLTNHWAYGGQPATSGTGGGRGLGGAICSLGGQLNLTNCQVANCGAAGGLGYFGSEYSGNGGTAQGGAFYVLGGSLNLDTVNLSSNRATGRAAQGGVGMGLLTASQGGNGNGGAIYASGASVCLNASVLTRNSAGVSGAQGPGLVSGSGDGNGLGGALYLDQGSTGAIDLCAFATNSASGPNANYEEPTGGGYGGGVFSAAPLQVLNSTFTADSASGGGGIGGTRTAQGGAICSTAQLVIAGCTFAGNQVAGGVGAGEGEAGNGADGQGGAVWTSAVLLATNSTWATNAASGGPAYQGLYEVGSGGSGYGGGIYVAGGSATLVNLTFDGNNANGGISYGPSGQGLGGGIGCGGGTTLMRNCIVAYSGNGGNVWPATGGSSALTDGGYNLSSDNSAGFKATGSLNSTDPLLGPLTNNGGPTATFLPWVGSPARDVIPSGYPATDQRGISRPQGPLADIGAVEAAFVPAPPLIVTQPVSVVVSPGATTNFSVVAAGLELSYQWWQGNTAVTSGTGPVLSINNAGPGAQGNYFVTVSNVTGVVTSTVVSLTFDASALSIFSGPASQNVAEGSSATFNVLASGVPTIYFQWQHQGTNIPGATASSFTIPSAGTNDGGAYSVIVSNGYNVLMSSPAQLTVIPEGPVILAQPSSVVVAPDASTNFTVTASGPALSYQWWHGPTPVPAATASNLLIAPALAGAQGNYFVVVSNFAGVVTSAVATLTFDATALNILAQPQATATSAGRTAVLSVLVSGIPSIGFQWYCSGAPVSNATGASLSFSPASTNDSGCYTVVVSNGYNVIVSSPAQLKVYPGAVPPLVGLSRSGTNLTVAFTAQSNCTYRLLCSTNLVFWSPAGTNSAVSDGPAQFIQPMASPYKFYRIVTP